jgi:hypothetical protein
MVDDKMKVTHRECSFPICRNSSKSFTANERPFAKHRFSYISDSGKVWF